MALGWLLKPTASSKTQSEDVATASLALPADDDLQMIEGVGPAIEKLLNKHEVYNFQDIIDAGVPGLEEILETGGSRFKMHIPTTWPDQARLASA
jgi:predicted flap endonuclease-1-like 5' DNA nuclease